MDLVSDTLPEEAIPTAYQQLPRHLEESLSSDEKFIDFNDMSALTLKQRVKSLV